MNMEQTNTSYCTVRAYIELARILQSKYYLNKAKEILKQIRGIK